MSVVVSIVFWMMSWSEWRVVSSLHDVLCTLNGLLANLSPDDLHHWRCWHTQANGGRSPQAGKHLGSHFWLLSRSVNWNEGQSKNCAALTQDVYEFDEGFMALVGPCVVEVKSVFSSISGQLAILLWYQYIQLTVMIGLAYMQEAWRWVLRPILLLHLPQRGTSTHLMYGQTVAKLLGVIAPYTLWLFSRVS